MVLLALETSSTLGSVALYRDDTLLEYRESHKQRSHSEFINSAIDSCLKAQSLEISSVDIYACGQGPGSFTGLRVAGNIAKSFCYTFDKPLVAIDSMTVLAAEASFPELSLTMLNAYQNMIYLGLFHRNQVIAAPVAIEIKDLKSFLSEKLKGLDATVKTNLPTVVGEGYKAYQEEIDQSLGRTINFNPNTSLFPTAKSLGLLAIEKARTSQTIEWNSFLPLYIRASAAEENLRRRS